MTKEDVLDQILQLIQGLEMPERRWLLARLSWDVKCHPDDQEIAELPLQPDKERS